MITDANGRCVLGGVDETGAYCDETVAVKTGRAYEVLRTVAPAFLSNQTFDDAFTFHNPQMYFLVYPGLEASKTDQQFSWHMGGGFVPLSIALGRGSPLVAPQSILAHPVLGSAALVTDGALQGVVLVDLYQLAVSNSFF